MCRYFATEITQLREHGLTLKIDEKTYSFRFNFFVSGDMKWVRLAYGLGGCSSTFGCLYCRIEKDIYSHLKDAKFGEGYDQPRSNMRSVALMRRLAATAAKARAKNKEKAAARKEKESKEKEEEETADKENVENEKKDPKTLKKEETKARRLETVGKKVENQEWEPAWDIEPSASPPERLHMLMCISRIFERTLALMLHPKETCIARGKNKQRTQQWSCGTTKSIAYAVCARSASTAGQSLATQARNGRKYW
jgi:hypothetical protein